MNYFPEIAELSSLFEEEVNRLGGTVADRFASGERLFLRALLPQGDRVQSNDFIGHGLAVRTRGTQVVVHPYTFRQVCSNGAIHVTNVSSRTVERAQKRAAAWGTVEKFREAIRACAQSEAFETNLSDMRQMLSQEVRMPLMMSALLSRLRNHSLVMQIMDRFLDQGERSVFGIMNAVTAEAREEPDPERRWQLEELGGGILATLTPPAPVLDPGSCRRLPKPAREAPMVAPK